MMSLVVRWRCSTRRAKSLNRRSPEIAAATQLGDRLAEASYQLTDLTADLARYLEGLDSQPGRLEQIAERRAQLSTLTRKYGTTCDEVLQWAAESAVRLTQLEQSDERIATLERASRCAGDGLDVFGWLRSALARHEAAGRFSELVLGRACRPGDAACPAELRGNERRARPVGCRPCGSDLRRQPGQRASQPGPGGFGWGVVPSPTGVGGRARGGSARPSRLVFDEIDAGVGGKVAVEVGRRLARLSQHTQVVVVTHLAQVAAFADRHYVVVKADDGQVTTSGVVQVADEDRAVELARMMAGLDTTESALAHAGELVELAASARASN